MRSIIYAAVLAIVGAMALAATASAASEGTVVTSETGGEAVKPTIHAVSEGGHLTLTNSIASITCNSTLEGKVEEDGHRIVASETRTDATGPLTVLTFSTCTNSWHVTTEKAGTISLEATSGYDATVKSSGALVKATRFLVPCNYETSNTTIGTFTGGNPATVHVAASIPKAAGSSELCGAGNAKWEGNYVMTSALYTPKSGLSVEPDPLELEPNKPKNIKIRNAGTVPFKNMGIGVADEKHFKALGDCEKKLPLGAGEICEVPIECLAAGKGEEGSVAAVSTQPPAFQGATLKC